MVEMEGGRAWIQIRSVLVLRCVCYLTAVAIADSITREHVKQLRDGVGEMFYHAFNGYMDHAFPLDECRRRYARWPYALTLEFQGLDNPNSPQEPPGVKPPPMRPHAPMSHHSTPPFTPSHTSAMGMQSIQPPVPPVRPFIPLRPTHNEVNSGTSCMQFQFMPTLGFMPPPPPPPHT